MKISAVDKRFWEKIVGWCALEDFKDKSRLDKSFYTAEQIINEFAGYIANPTSRLIQIEDNGEAIGFILLKDLDFKNRRCEFHLQIPELKDRKPTLAYKILLWLIDYTFNQLNLNKIKTAVLSNNDEILKIMERLSKIGFEKEGVLRKEYFLNGKFEDLHCFSLIREDFKKEE